MSTTTTSMSTPKDDDTTTDTTDRRKKSSSPPFLIIGGTPIYFEEDWDSGIGGGLWSTGLAMATYLAQYPQHACQNLKFRIQQKQQQQQLLEQEEEDYNNNINNNKNSTATTTSTTKLSLLELGSGNGFLSVCFLALGYKDSIFESIVLTDTKNHLPLMERTLHANSHIARIITAPPRDNDNDGSVVEPATSTTTTDSTIAPPPPQKNQVQVHILEHQWGVFDMTENALLNNTTTFDYIIGSDVAYRDELHDPLITSLLQFSNVNTICLIGVTMADTKPIFFHKLQLAGFQYEKLADHYLEPKFRGSTFGIFIIQKKKEKTKPPPVTK